ncbi:MAG: pyridoxal-dependent decarboxylase, partial [Anaerolineae bacterium]|nr:pyridoxal-dependent decarboxylase [Anaerolineae bacterium]
AGNVNSGAFDPAVEICSAARAAGAWVHVDGAFGLWGRVSNKYNHLTHGYELADSWGMDAHKWLNVPYDSGLVICKNPAAITAAMSTRAAYLIESGGREPFDYVPEMSRRGRGIEVWAALYSLGRSGLAGLIERNCRQAQEFAAGLAAAGFEILNDVVLNQVVVRFGPQDITEKVIAAVQSDGTMWAGGTTWQGKTAMRISFSSWKTTDADVEKSLAAILRIAGDKIK